jgi:hypothetical protein
MRTKSILLCSSDSSEEKSMLIKQFRYKVANISLPTKRSRGVQAIPETQLARLVCLPEFHRPSSNPSDSAIAPALARTAGLRWSSRRQAALRVELVAGDASGGAHCTGGLGTELTGGSTWRRHSGRRLEKTLKTALVKTKWKPRMKWRLLVP